MIEVKVTRIEPVPDGEIVLMDARTSAQVWLVPVIFQLADGCHVTYHRKVHGTMGNARLYADSLPLVPTYPTTCIFNVEDELVNVRTRMVPEAVCV